MKLSKLSKAGILIVTLIIADQVLKFWVKTHMTLGEEIKVIGNWFILLFVENNGMAFGLEFAGEYGKIFLSIFRIIAVVAIGWILVRLSKRNLPMGFIASIALIFTGAIGNIIDSAFYGLIFDHSYGQVASFLPEGGGYSSFLHGRVVDMFYFPIIQGHFPDWFPFWKGENFIFFRPVFNIADSSITIGIFTILIFYREYFNKPLNEEKAVKQEEVAPEQNSEGVQE